MIVCKRLFGVFLVLILLTVALVKKATAAERDFKAWTELILEWEWPKDQATVDDLFLCSDEEKRQLIAAMDRAVEQDKSHVGPALHAMTLLNIHAAEIGPLLEMGFEQGRKPSKAAAWAALRAGPRHVRRLGQLLESENEDVRTAAAKTLMQLDWQAAAATQPLIEALDDDAKFVREYARQALTRLAPYIRPQMAAALRHESAQVRDGVAQALLHEGYPGGARAIRPARSGDDQGASHSVG